MSPHSATATPIPYPDRAAVVARSRQRAGADNLAWLQQNIRLEELIKAADQQGHNRGERAGFRLGYRWGLVCGGCAGSLGMACAWLLTTQLPHWLS